MESVQRAVKVPVDGCPRCLEGIGQAVMATFNHDDQWGGSTQVVYKCSVAACANSWFTTWSMTYVSELTAHLESMA